MPSCHIGNEVIMTDQEQASKISEIIEAYPADQRFALAAMQDMQHAFNYIPEEGLSALAAYLGCAEAQLYSMATFYKALSLTPKGDHIVKICNGTACHLRGAMNLATELKRNLGIDPGETTEDGMFTLDALRCIGACSLAPAVSINGRVFPKMTTDSVEKIVEDYRAGVYA